MVSSQTGTRGEATPPRTRTDSITDFNSTSLVVFVYSVCFFFYFLSSFIRKCFIAEVVVGFFWGGGNHFSSLASSLSFCCFLSFLISKKKKNQSGSFKLTPLRGSRHPLRLEKALWKERLTFELFTPNKPHRPAERASSGCFGNKKGLKLEESRKSRRRRCRHAALPPFDFSGCVNPRRAAASVTSRKPHMNDSDLYWMLMAMFEHTHTPYNGLDTNRRLKITPPPSSLSCNWPLPTSQVQAGLGPTANQTAPTW